jgi:hypothetical protein
MEKNAHADRGHRGRGVVERKDGRSLRRTTIYFPPELAEKLRMQSARTDRPVSDIVVTAVERFLSA